MRVQYQNRNEYIEFRFKYETDERTERARETNASQRYLLLCFSCFGCLTAFFAKTLNPTKRAVFFPTKTKKRESYSYTFYPPQRFIRKRYIFVLSLLSLSLYLLSVSKLSLFIFVFRSRYCTLIGC